MASRAQSEVDWRLEADWTLPPELQPKADRDFEMLVHPGAGHGAAGTPYGQRRQRDFLVRNLLGVEPRHD